MSEKASPDVVFRRAIFRHFKALEDYSLTLDSVNVLTGPNNSGKSTVIGAFRALAAALRSARSRNPQWLQGPDGRRLGYQVPREGIPISLENARTDYRDHESLVVFELSNCNSLQFQFTDSGPCQMFPRLGDTAAGPKDRAEFLRCFPVTVGVVPVLGPVEHEEVLINKATVDRNLATHRASRNFRNYWYHYPEGFEVFASLLAATWPGMEIGRPEPTFGDRDAIIQLFCQENRITRELYWSGFWFHIWAQLLTHICREKDATLLVVDEPETYLHPDLHRRLYRLLKESANTVLLATHSSEIITEAEPDEVLVVDKTKRSAKRLANVDAALEAIGSSRTTTFTAVARTERVLFVEGDDARILAQLAARAGKGDLALEIGLTTIPLGGHRPKDAAAIAKGISEAIGTRAKFAIVLDKDFRCQEELSELHESLATFWELVHTHGRKEIENYALAPRALLKAVRKAQERQRQFSGKDRVPVEMADIECVLAEGAEALRIDSQVQFVEKRIDFLRSKGSAANRVAIGREAVVEFEGAWSRAEARLAIIGGKSALAAVNAALAERYAVTLTVGSIVSELDRDELPGELTLFLSQLDRFRNHG